MVIQCIVVDWLMRKYIIGVWQNDFIENVSTANFNKNHISDVGNCLVFNIP